MVEVIARKPTLRLLGKSGLSVSPLAWGMWRFAGEDVRAAAGRVEAALDAGINLFDTADVYGLDNGEAFGAAETLLGQVFDAAPALRRHMVLATKGGIELGTPYNSTAEYLVAACEASLKRLRVERVDLYQIHRPDILAHPAEVAAGLERLRVAGKIAEAGVSNYTPAQVSALRAHLPFELASIQPEFSPLCIAPLIDGALDQALELGVGVLAWSPFGAGRLGQGGEDERIRAVAAALDNVAQQRASSRAQIAYAWIMAHPARPIPIVGSQRPDRIRHACGALDIALTKAEWYKVLTAARGAPLP